MSIYPDQPICAPRTIPEAVEALARLGETAVAVAGGTWVMRAPLRGEDRNKVFVSLRGIKDLHAQEMTPSELRLGPLVTHDQLARLLEGKADLAALRQAAEASANPMVRRAATVGGNICTSGFPSPDLVPALLALEAEVELQTVQGARGIALEDYLSSRDQATERDLLTKIIVRRSAAVSAHARLLLRKAGEYPVANVSMAVTFSPDRQIERASIAVGSVEHRPKRWRALEDRLLGASAAESDIKSLSQSCLSDFTARDGPDAPGWYRLRVVPTLAARAFSKVAAQARLEV